MREQDHITNSWDSSGLPAPKKASVRPVGPLYLELQPFPLVAPRLLCFSPQHVPSCNIICFPYLFICPFPPEFTRGLEIIMSLSVPFPTVSQCLAYGGCKVLVEFSADWIYSCTWVGLRCLRRRAGGRRPWALEKLGRGAKPARQEEPRECEVLEAKEAFQGGGRERSSASYQVFLETKPATVELGSSRIAYSAYKLEFQPALMSYELILYLPGISGPENLY